MDLKNKQEKCKYPGFWNFLEDTVPVFFSNYFPFPFLFCHSFSYSDISVAGIFSKVHYLYGTLRVSVGSSVVLKRAVILKQYRH